MYYARSYRENGKPKQETVERIGYIDEFTSIYDDPLAHFKQIAKEKTKALQEQRKSVSIELAPEALLPFDSETGSYNCVKNLGHAAISAIFHRLDIHTFLDRRRKYLEISYNLTAVMKLLVYERILHPGSKRAAWANRTSYFDKMDFDLNAINRSLSILPRYRKDPLQQTVRDASGYRKFDENGQLIAEADTKTKVEFMYKVLDEAKDTSVKTHEGNTVRVKGVGHYQIVYWSAKYAKRAQLDRQAAVEKAMVASRTPAAKRFLTTITGRTGCLLYTKST